MKVPTPFSICAFAYEYRSREIVGTVPLAMQLRSSLKHYGALFFIAILFLVSPRQWLSNLWGDTSSNVISITYSISQPPYPLFLLLHIIRLLLVALQIRGHYLEGHCIKDRRLVGPQLKFNDLHAGIANNSDTWFLLVRNKKRSMDHMLPGS